MAVVATTMVKQGGTEDVDIGRDMTSMSTLGSESDDSSSRSSSSGESVRSGDGGGGDVMDVDMPEGGEVEGEEVGGEEDDPKVLRAWIESLEDLVSTLRQR